LVYDNATTDTVASVGLNTQVMAYSSTGAGPN